MVAPASWESCPRFRYPVFSFSIRSLPVCSKKMFIWSSRQKFAALAARSGLLLLPVRLDQCPPVNPPPL